jgi:hypothetical protein
MRKFIEAVRNGRKGGILYQRRKEAATWSRSQNNIKEEARLKIQEILLNIAESIEKELGLQTNLNEGKLHEDKITK